MGARRLKGVDLVRGAAMVLMALDHVRVYSGLPAGGPTPGIFFTRWATHFAAPAFAFLAGAAAFLHGQRLEGRAALARHLAGRGLLLVALELTVVRLAWTFNLGYARASMAGVLWMLGWCMALLAPLCPLPPRAVGALGVLVVALHGLLAGARPGGRVASVVYFGGPVALGPEGPTLFVLYSIVPWVGVMAAGYGFAPVLRLDPARRDRVCFAVGAGAVALFALLRALDGYGDPRPWHAATPAPAALRFLDTTKYPASLLFLSMTLGPTVLALPFAERARGRLAEALSTFGRVPLFYYLLHLPLIHLAAILVSLAREGAVNPWLFADHPAMNPPPPEGYAWGLTLLYAVFAAVVVALYPACLWYARQKARHPDGPLRYF